MKKKSLLLPILIPTVFTVIILVVAYQLIIANREAQQPGGQPKQITWQDKTPSEWCELLNHGNPLVRAKSRDALAQYGSEAVDELTRVVADRSSGFARVMAAQSLGLIGHDAKAAGPTLLDSLADDSWPGRDAAARSLGMIGYGTDASITALTGALNNDPDEVVQVAAADALGQLGKQAESSLPTLEKAVKSDSWALSEAAKEAIRNIQGQ